MARKSKLAERNPRLAAIATLLLSEMIVIEKKRDDCMLMGFGESGAPPEQLAMLQDQMDQLAECQVALKHLDRLGTTRKAPQPRPAQQLVCGHCGETTNTVGDTMYKCSACGRTNLVP